MLASLNLHVLTVLATTSLVVGAVIFVPTWRILTKTGYSGWYALVFLLPIFNVLGLWMFAFAEWPIERKSAAIDGHGRA
ncbi:MAG TPA: hypothetical protein VFS34_05465 [Thermoanaerobaculia bacterium]|nr:hypothetical protein [Thermoanaerobaculia bacterium]